jgi:hypothetical protein
LAAHWVFAWFTYVQEQQEGLLLGAGSRKENTKNHQQ